MRKTSLTCGFALGALMIGVAGTATADDHGFYADVGVGAASYPVDMKAQLNGVPYVQKERTNHFAYSFAAGYRINRYVGVELGFVDFGNPEVNLEDPADRTKSVGQVRLSAKGKSLAMLAHVPMGDWDSFFRVGVIQATLGTRHSIKQGMYQFDYFASAERPSLLLGVGTRYAFAEQWALSFSVDYYNRVGQEDWANLISPRFGVSYRF
jgi:hypothetical protein